LTTVEKIENFFRKRVDEHKRPPHADMYEIIMGVRAEDRAAKRKPASMQTITTTAWLMRTQGLLWEVDDRERVCYQLPEHSREAVPA